MNKITLLGTGHATVTRCYNTCFTLQTPHTILLADAGGGNGILSQLEKTGIPIANLHHLFVTHAHTDHVLGVIWILRMVASCKDYQGLFHVYSHDKVLSVVQTIVNMTFSKKDLEKMNERVVFHEVSDGDSWEAGDIHLQCFDIHSTKEKQFGFRALLPRDNSKDRLTLVCLGDEPYNPANRDMAEQADWLMCEAFCLYADRERFKPYEKCHSTALDAGRLAEELEAKHLILYHTEDKTLDTRKKTYTEEARKNFHGEVVVPDDLETILLG